MAHSTEAYLAPPAHNHAHAAVLFRRPFAPGAIGFRAMTRSRTTASRSGVHTSPPTSAPNR